MLGGKMSVKKKKLSLSKTGFCDFSNTITSVFMQLFFCYMWHM
jgi:hypothetical protein